MLFFIALILSLAGQYPLTAKGQLQSAPPVPLFHDHFSDPPSEELWQGDLGYFRTVPDHDPGMLRLDAPSDLGTAYLSTRHAYRAVHWEWYMRQAFAPSNNNRTFVYLNEATGRLDDYPTGLAVRAGENGSPKHFRLFHFDGGTASPELLKSDTEIQTDTGYRIRLLLTPDRELHLYIAEGRTGTPLMQSHTAELPESMVMEGHFGFLARYTTTRSDQFYFSDVWIAESLPMPGIASFSVSSANDPSHAEPHPWHNENAGTVITVTFEIPPEPNARQPVLFRLENDTTPDKLYCGHPQICSLLFRDHLPSGEQRLTVESYWTIYGQQSLPETHVFMVADGAEPGDVVINEFMYRPPAGITSYVELFNRSDKLLNLRNWRLQRRAVSTEPERLITGNDLYLPPGGYLVLTPDVAMLKNMHGAANLLEMAAFPRFNTASSDEIRLFSGDGGLIDSLQYVPSHWGGYEVALERKSPDVPGWIPENWAESLAEHRGTPGGPNSVRPPDIPPELTEIDYSQPHLLELTFSHRLDSSSIAMPGAIRLFDTGDIRTNVSHNEAGSTRLAGDREPYREIPVTMTYAGEKQFFAVPMERMQHGVRYLVLISEIRDIFGNRIDPVETEFRYYDTSSPKVRDVIINEVLYRPGATGRFVEILNRSDKVFDLRGWKVGRSLGSATVIAGTDASEPAFLIPGELAVISEPGLVLSGTEARHFEISGFLLLSRFGDTVYLVSDESITMDSLAYEPTWGGNRDGVSLERIDPEGATNDPANWMGHPDSHSAGMANHHFEALPDPVSLLRALLVDETRITLTFSRHIGLSGLSGVTLGQSLLEAVITKDTPEYGSSYHFQTAGLIERRQQDVQIGSVRDFAGRENRELSTPLVFPPDPDEIIINEVMYQPIADRYSRRADQSEYVEAYNRSGLHLKMDRVYLHDRPDKNRDVRKLHPADSDLVTLAPGQYVVFYADTSSVFRNSRLSRAFPEADPTHALFLRMDRLTLGLSTQGGEVYLATDSRRILDSLWYHPSWHNPNLPDVRGISLERIHSGLPTGDHTNWTSSASPDGGTPGQANTAMVQPYGVSEQPGLALSPNPFSPNGNGIDDHLVIHYSLDGPDYMILVRVFDRHGRRVRTLADGLAAGRSGKLLWDGRTDRGIMNRAGIYIVHLEAWHAAHSTRRSYREVAVLAFPL
jgi:hypothetical protein